MEVKFGGVLTKDEFLRAARLIDHPLSKKPQVKIDLWALLIFAASVLAGAGLWQIVSSPAIYLIGVVLIVAGIIFAGAGLRLRTALAQLWDKNDAFRAKRDVVVTDDHIEIHTSSGQSRLRWSDFSGYGEYQGLLVLFRGAGIAHTFPARFFQSEAEWLQFKALTTERLPLTHRVGAINWANVVVWALIIISTGVVVIFGLAGVSK